MYMAKYDEFYTEKNENQSNVEKNKENRSISCENASVLD